MNLLPAELLFSEIEFRNFGGGKDLQVFINVRVVYGLVFLLGFGILEQEALDLNLTFPLLDGILEGLVAG